MLKAKHARRLEEDPITVNISETEQFTLRPMDPRTLPTKKEADQVFQLMTSTNEYKNLIPFLTGLQMSNLHISSDRWEYLIRHSGSAGKLNLIVECARQQSKTGLSFDTIGVARCLFFEFHSMAQAADFKGPAAAQALRLAQTTARAMDWNSSQTRVEAAKDPRCQPFVIGTLLELSAARVLNEVEGKEEGPEVSKYAQKLVACWELGRTEPDFEGQPKRRLALDSWFKEVLPVYNGLKLSLSVKNVSGDKRLKSAVTSRLAELKAAIEKHVQSSDEANPTHSHQLAKSLLSA